MSEKGTGKVWLSKPFEHGSQLHVLHFGPALKVFMLHVETPICVFLTPLDTFNLSNESYTSLSKMGTFDEITEFWMCFVSGIIFNQQAFKIMESGIGRDSAAHVSVTPLFGMFDLSVMGHQQHV